MNVTTIVLIPGLWMTALGWERWVKHYSQRGYGVIAANWPGMDGEIETLRHDPSSFSDLGLTEIIDHYEQIIRRLETPPIIIGHGLGGLVTQVLLDRGWGAAGVAIAPTSPKSVSRFSLGTLKAALSALGNLFSRRKARSLTFPQFHGAFANTEWEPAAIAVYERYVIPAPSRIFLQTAFANFYSDAPSTVRFDNDSRAALLLIAGGKDRLAPSSTVKANFDSYRESKAETDYKEFPDESYVTLLQELKVADYALGWALCRVNGSKLTAVQGRTDSWSVQLST